MNLTCIIFLSVSKEIHANGKAFWFFFPPDAKPSKQTAVMLPGFFKAVLKRMNLVTDHNDIRVLGAITVAQ